MRCAKIIASKIKPYSTPLLTILSSIALLQLPKENFYLHIFLILKNVILLTETNRLLWFTLRPFKQNYLATVFFKVIEYGYERFQNANPTLKNHNAKK